MGSPSYLLRERSHACMAQTKKPRISALSTADSVKKLPAPAAGVRMNGIVTGHGPIACHAGAGLRGGMKRVLRQVHRLGSALRYRAVTSFNGAATGLPSSAGTKQGLSRQRVNKAPPPASGRWRRKIATVLRELRAILNLARWRMPARHVRIVVQSKLSNADINRRVTNETAKDRVRRGSCRPPRIVACFSFDQSSGFRPRLPIFSTSSGSPPYLVRP
jgi:hypothetical protein